MNTQIISKKGKLWFFFVALILSFLLSGADSATFGYMLSTPLLALLFLFLAERSAATKFAFARTALIIIFSLLLGVALQSWIATFISELSIESLPFLSLIIGGVFSYLLIKKAKSVENEPEIKNDEPEHPQKTQSS